jgi:hypothetical protein
LLTIKKKMSFRLLLVFLSMFQTFLLNAQSFDIGKYILNSKIGIATGVNFYVGTAGDGKITFQKGNYSELKNLTGLYLVTRLNQKWDIGFRYAEGHLWSLFVNNEVIAFETHSKDFQLIANTNITPDIFRGKGLNLEALFGLGLARFHSKMYSIDKQISTFSTSIGYGRDETNVEGVKIHEAQERTTFLVSSGIKLNYHLFSKFNLFWESRLNLTTSSKFSGNMYRNSPFPPDAFWSNVLGLELSLGQRGNLSKRIRCPRF